MNSIRGIISAIENEGGLSLIEITYAKKKPPLKVLVVESPEHSRFVVMGLEVNVLFKETEASLSLGREERISIENQLPAVVSAIRLGKLLTVVEVRIEESLMKVVISNLSLPSLSLHEGKNVIILLRATDLTISKA